MDRKETCIWERNPEHIFNDHYLTGCDKSILFSTNDGIKITEFKYCPYCGEEIEEVTNGS